MSAQQGKNKSTMAGKIRQALSKIWTAPKDPLAHSVEQRQLCLKWMFQKSIEEHSPFPEDLLELVHDFVEWDKCLENYDHMTHEERMKNRQAIAHQVITPYVERTDLKSSGGNTLGILMSYQVHLSKGDIPSEEMQALAEEVIEEYMEARALDEVCSKHSFMNEW